VLKHLPFSGFNASGDKNCSFLYQAQSFYFMDNHRLALWCWAKSLKPSATYNYFHLDAHYDTRPCTHPMSIDHAATLNLDEYRDCPHPDGTFPLYLWDNYVMGLYRSEHTSIRRSVFATHEVGTAPSCSFESILSYDLLQKFPKLFVDELQWIINLDLDYFYARGWKNELMFSVTWIEEFFSLVHKHYLLGDTAVITVALSPECCGSWDNALKVVNIWNRIFPEELRLNL
jgi:hypothetical protein